MDLKKSIELTYSSGEGLKKAVTEGVSFVEGKYGSIEKVVVIGIEANVTNGEIYEWEIKMKFILK